MIYDQNWSSDSLNDRSGKALYVYPSYGQSNRLFGLYTLISKLIHAAATLARTRLAPQDHSVCQVYSASA